jgi:radical SAM superfamily enzyme YgiQ (UPF0313 family)
MTDIILATINAKYIHTAFGLRYLYANMGELQTKTQLCEFTLENRPLDIAEQLIKQSPKIIGLGVYIWNATETSQLVHLLKTIDPQIIIILGGPEVSYEHQQQTLVNTADYVITGQGEISFPQLCQQLLQKQKPLNKVIDGISAPLEQLQLPYELYQDKDIAHRIIYVEASRGCPFKCEFCLSSLDKTAKPFELQRFLNAMDQLHQRGVRHFKFVDRTFNLKISTTIHILEFFLQRLSDDLFLHFELIPDHLPEALKQTIQRFPKGCLQFEIGIQTFNPNVQTLISRKQNNEKSKANIHWLREESHAYLHTDLIFGLPSDNLTSFADSFNQLVALNPHEIQVGILKRLRGSPIIRHTEKYQLVFNPHPPYNILSTDRIDFHTLQAMNRFARYWDMIANSGRFPHSLTLLLADKPFESFWQLSQWLFETTQQTHKIALRRLYDLVYQGLIECFTIKPEIAINAIQKDVERTAYKGSIPECLRQHHHKKSKKASTASHRFNQRQQQHQ